MKCHDAPCPALFFLTLIAQTGCGGEVTAPEDEGPPLPEAVGSCAEFAVDACRPWSEPLLLTQGEALGGVDIGWQGRVFVIVHAEEGETWTSAVTPSGEVLWTQRVGAGARPSVAYRFPEGLIATSQGFRRLDDRGEPDGWFEPYAPFAPRDMIATALDPTLALAIDPAAELPALVVPRPEVADDHDPHELDAAIPIAPIQSAERSVAMTLRLPDGSQQLQLYSTGTFGLQAYIDPLVLDDDLTTPDGLFSHDMRFVVAFHEESHLTLLSVRYGEPFTETTITLPVPSTGAFGAVPIGESVAFATAGVLPDELALVRYDASTPASSPPIALGPLGEDVVVTAWRRGLAAAWIHEPTGNIYLNVAECCVR